MDRVRAKFTVSNLLKDKYDNVVVKLYAVYKGDESSPENESFPMPHHQAPANY